MPPVILQFLGSVIKGLPLINTIASKIFPPKTVTATVGSEVKDVIIPEKETALIYLTRLIVEAITVWGFVYLMKHEGVTYNDLVSLFGLIKQ